MYYTIIKGDIVHTIYKEKNVGTKNEPTYTFNDYVGII